MTLGVNLNALRILGLLSLSILAGIGPHCVDPLFSPIAFVGMAVPHLGRGALETSDLRWLLPAVTLVGASSALMANLLSQELIQSLVLTSQFSDYFIESTYHHCSDSLSIADSQLAQQRLVQDDEIVKYWLKYYQGTG